MNSTPLPKPMKPAEFYALLAFSRGELYTYPLKAIIYNDSHGSVKVPENKAYELVQKLVNDAYLDMVGPRPAGLMADETPFDIQHMHLATGIPLG